MSKEANDFVIQADDRDYLEILSFLRRDIEPPEDRISPGTISTELYEKED